MRSPIEPFHAMEVSRLAHRLKAEGRSILHMEFGQPSTGAPPDAIALAHQLLDSDPMGYWDSPYLAEGLAKLYQRRYGVAVDPARFILTCGASPALVAALAANFAAGERVVTARPGYVAYRNTIKALHLTPVEIPCGPATRYQLCAAHLEEMEEAPAGVIVASPANPTGTIIARDELARIAEVCRRRHVTIISDEIYHGLSYVEPAASLLEFDPNAYVIGSFSKYFSMVAWRLGWLLVPEGEEDRVRAFSANMFLTAPSLSQHMGLVALEAEEALEGHVRVYARNRELLLEALPKLGLTKIAPPDGAFYIYADVRHLTDDSMVFCKQLLIDTGIAAAPGIDFDPVEGRHFIRLSFAVSTAEVEEAIARLTGWFGKTA